MTEIRFGKDRYHEIQEMISWLMHNIGHGGYLNEPENFWYIEQAFGSSFFRFKREQDAMLFGLKWL